MYIIPQFVNAAQGILDVVILLIKTNIIAIIIEDIINILIILSPFLLLNFLGYII